MAIQNILRKTISFNCCWNQICRRLEGLSFTRHVINRKYTSIEDNIVRSEVNLEIPDDSVYNFMMRSFVKNQNNIALLDGITKQSLTFNDLHYSVRSFGASLLKHGFGEGDVLGLMSSNNPQFAIATIGTHGCKGIVSPINPTYTERELVHQLKDSKAKILVVEEANVAKALKASEHVGLDKIFVIGNSNVNHSNVIPWKEVIEECNRDFPTAVCVDGNKDVAFLPYSSGTTGKPKGVILSHSNIIGNILQYNYLTNVVPCTSTLAILPLFHIYGLVITLLYNLQKGSTVVTLPQFRPDTFLENLAEHKIESMNIVPPLLQFLVKSELVKCNHLHYVKDITTAAAPCAKDLQEATRKKFPKVFVRQGYGLTETSPAAIIQGFDHIESGSIGFPIPNTEVKVVDTNTGESLPANTPGEVCIRGPQVMKGYLNRPEATRQCVTEDGWFHTGDVGYYDKQLQFFIIDRLKELIKYKGYQVPPAELEGLLLTHPKVIDAAVIGIQDENLGEVPKAFVIAADASKEELLAFVEDRVAPHKKLRGGIEFVKEIPRAQSGKILRRVLREQHASPSVNK